MDKQDPQKEQGGEELYIKKTKREGMVEFMEERDEGQVLKRLMCSPKKPEFHFKCAG